MRKVLISLWILIGLISCEKNTDSSLINSGLIGTWEWIRTDGGIFFNIHESPSSTGNTYLLKIYVDHKIVIYENEIKVFSGVYKIEKKKSIYSGGMEDYLQIIGEYQIQCLVISGIVSVDNNTLSISDNCYDGVGSSYVRHE